MRTAIDLFLTKDACGNSDASSSRIRKVPFMAQVRGRQRGWQGRMIDAGQPSENQLTTSKIGRANSYCCAWLRRLHCSGRQLAHGSGRRPRGLHQREQTQRTRTCVARVHATIWVSPTAAALALDAPPPIIIVSTPITAGFAADPREMRSNSQPLAARDALSLHGVNQFLVDDRLEVRQPRTEKGRQMPLASTDDRLPVAAILLVWLAAALAMAMLYWPRLDESFASPDNLMRLVQVRALLDGAPWFDPHEPRLAPQIGYDTHWSRLIDAGIAGLIVLFRQLVAPDLAERLARCIWPLLLSGPAVFAVTAIAVRLGGPGAGRAALMAALPTLALLPTFRPGEIDHHNAQVTLSLITFAFAVWGDRAYFAAAAGIAAGALLGVGLEAAYVPMFVAAGFGLLFVHDPAWASPARHFGGALALSTLAFYFVLTPTALRFAPAC